MSPSETITPELITTAVQRQRYDALLERHGLPPLYGIVGDVVRTGYLLLARCSF